MAVPRRRALFGLLDADGWSWASVKAFGWLVLIIFMLGYLPDRAYYLTVGRTVDLGVLVWSPINLCPPSNETLPCPAPVGALIPFHPSPAELALPEPRTDGSVIQVGTQLYYFGGSNGTTATADVFYAPTVEVGNFDKWQRGPSLPAPRANASVAYVAGTIYLIGGVDASGVATKTVYTLSPDPQTGSLGEWRSATELDLPDGRSGASIVVVPDGVLLIGGRDPAGQPTKTTWKTHLSATGALGAWSAEAQLFAAQADGSAVLIGDHVWLYGGSDANGPVGAVQRGEFGQEAAEGLPENPDAGKVTGWAVNNASNLPVARTNAAGWGANGAIYLAGGNDGSGPQPEVYWAVPTIDGELTEWKHLETSDLPAAGLEGGAAVVSGPNVIIVGGVTDTGLLASSVRANTAPLSPYFQLGLVGATVPGLQIEGEIGQQLGYLNAAGVGTVNFILLILIGVAYAHKAQTKGLLGRFLKRRGR